MKRSNIFKFATSELSTSAFNAWLLESLNPDIEVEQSVKQAGIKFLNHCLVMSSIAEITIQDIEVVNVKTERQINKNKKNRIDVYAEIKLKSIAGHSVEKILLYIENKTSANETKENQLKEYSSEIFKEFQKMEEKEKSISPILIYLKSKYDFDDPLKYYNKEKNESEPKGKFKKINWESLYKIFQEFEDSDNNYLMDYSRMVVEEYKKIKKQLNTTEIKDLIKINNHISHFQMIKSVFNEYFDKNEVEYTGYDKKKNLRYVFKENGAKIQPGTSSGNKWSVFFPDEFNKGWGAPIWYRIEKLNGVVLLRAGSYPANEDKEELNNIFWDLVDEFEMRGIVKKNNNRKDGVFYFCRIQLDQADILSLRKLNKITKKYIGVFSEYKSS